MCSVLYFITDISFFHKFLVLIWLLLFTQAKYVSIFRHPFGFWNWSARQPIRASYLRWVNFPDRTHAQFVPKFLFSAQYRQNWDMRMKVYAKSWPCACVVLPHRVLFPSRLPAFLSLRHCWAGNTQDFIQSSLLYYISLGKSHFLSLLLRRLRALRFISA